MHETKLILSDFELERLYIQEGMRQREIAEMYGCTVSAVSLRMKKAGITCRSPRDYPTTEKVRAAWIDIGRRRKGHKMSEEQRELLSKSMRGKRKRTDYEFGGHEKKRGDGYVKVYAPNHPRCSKDGYVMKHILVVEREIGRYLEPNECVHHINHIRDDNRTENLRLMTKSDHMSMHMKERHANRRANLC